MPALSVSNLCKRFGGVRAVEDVSFDLAAGEILGLIGPNGSGKSTTLSLIMGVTRPDEGLVRLGGKNVVGRPTHAMAKTGMAMVFQHSRPLYRQTVLENIELALLPDTVFQLFKSAHVADKARKAARSVGLADVLDHHPGSLPFAYLRRLELAKALAAEPDILLLDEPFAGLAPRETREFSALIRAQRDAGRAIVLVDHNVKAVSGLVDRIAAMHSGRKIAEGTPGEVTADPRVREVYFGRSLESAERARELGRTTGDARILDIDLEAVRYDQAAALRDIRLHVDEGEFVSVVGLNGAGKTTLFNNVLGFKEYAGDIRWRGRSLRGRRPAAIANDGIALCPETRELFAYMTVRENLELGGHALDRTARRRQVEEVWTLFPVLRERAKQNAYTLSGGEQQMLTIGRALMARPSLLLLDEPTLGLAPRVIDDISQALDALQQRAGLTVLLAEQNLTFAVRHSERIYLLETGALRWHGRADRFVEEVGDDML